MNNKFKPVVYVILAAMLLTAVSCSTKNKGASTFEYLKSQDISASVINPLTVFIEAYDSTDTPFGWEECPVTWSAYGYRGENYQRFYIHFDTVYKSDAYVYGVTGRTRYMDTIRSFAGTIILDSVVPIEIGEYEASYYDLLGIQESGRIYGHYSFYEDSAANGSGMLSGKATFTYLKRGGQLYYDTDGIDYADGFENNQYEGVWHAYDKKRSETCNWGHFRIPNSSRLDIGCAEFSPDSEYAQFGWALLHDFAYCTYGTPQWDSIRNAIDKDNNWWKDK